ncbi:MAG: hypothetical protein WCT36_03680 [Candidatus Gracilibacteria bacterium]
MGQLYKDLFNLKPTDETPFDVLTDASRHTTIFIKPDMDAKCDHQRYGFAWNRPIDGMVDGAIEHDTDDYHYRVQEVMQEVPRAGWRGKLGLKRSVKKVTYQLVGGHGLPLSVGMDKLVGGDVYWYIGTVGELSDEVRARIDALNAA